MTTDSVSSTITASGLNETLTPAGQNIVTELYNKHDLHGKVHHESGAVITENILGMYDLIPILYRLQRLCPRASKPMNLTAEDFKLLYNRVENQILYDADTMDPNVRLHGFLPKHSHPLLFCDPTRKF